MTDSDLYYLLQQQINEHLSSVDVSSTPWKEFLASIDAAYQKFDIEQRTLEQSLTLSAEELVQANEEMNAVFAAIPDQLFHLDADGRVISYKLGQSSYFYLRSEKLINQHIKMF